MESMISKCAEFAWSRGDGGRESGALMGVKPSTGREEIGTVDGVMVIGGEGVGSKAGVGGFNVMFRADLTGDLGRIETFSSSLLASRRMAGLSGMSSLGLIEKLTEAKHKVSYISKR